MAHFAKVLNGKVLQVIAAEPEFFDSFVDSSPGKWLQTSYHNNIRKNFAGIGFDYDEGRDAFIAPKPFDSWQLDESSCQWQAPSPMPQDGKSYYWDEGSLSWKARG